MLESLDCFVLAGGKSTRFGTNKSLASIGSRHMAAVVANNLGNASGLSVRLIGAGRTVPGRCAGA